MDKSLTKSFVFKCALLALSPFVLVAVLAPMCSRISDPVGNTGRGIGLARELYIGAKSYEAEHGHFPDLPTVLVAMQHRYSGEESFVPTIKSVKGHHPPIQFISTLAATDGQFVFAASAPFRKDYSSRDQLYRIVVPAEPDESGSAQFMIEEEAFQSVLEKVQRAAAAASETGAPVDE